MPENDAPLQNTDWLTIPEVAEAIGETPGRVRRLLDEHYLIGSRRNGPVTVPAVFLVDGAPLGSLRGTIIALPVTILFLFVQKRLVGGLTAGAVKS